MSIQSILSPWPIGTGEEGLFLQGARMGGDAAWYQPWEHLVVVTDEKSFFL